MPYRYETCAGCGQKWNVSAQAKIPRSGYICPRCRNAERRGEPERRKPFAAIAILWFMEVSMATVAGAVVAAIVVPLTLLERGYFSLGGEWLLVMAATLLAYHLSIKPFSDGSKVRR